jgi:hypothetical protein
VSPVTFTYTDPNNSLLEAVRFYSQDVDPQSVFLSDEEIGFIISQWADVSAHPLYLAAACCETISAKFAREVSYSADGVSVGAQELQGKYDLLATSLRDTFKSIDVGDGPDVGGIMVGETIDSSIKPLVWAKGGMDNRDAGQQDFGGTQEGQEVYSESYYF